MTRSPIPSSPALLLVLVVALSAGCSAPWMATPHPGPTAAPAPATYAVGLRSVTFSDPSRLTNPTPGQPAAATQGRTLQVTIWYPAAGIPGAAVRAGATPARGPFPVVLFSHGLLGMPADYQALTTRWAGTGLVVVAPAYPLTSRESVAVQALDVVNQPADATFVLTSTLRLSATPGDPFQGLLDGRRMAAAGHSLGAITTVGLLSTCCRDARLRAGVVLAGNWLGFSNTYTGPAAPVLFEHGDRDQLVPYASAQRTFGAVPWPKAFVTLDGEGHLDPYLQPASPAFAVVAATTTEVLRWSLLADRTALDAFRRDSTVTGTAHVDDRL